MQKLTVKITVKDNDWTWEKDFADLVIEYFPQETFDIQKPETHQNLNLKLIFNSSINIEILLDLFNSLKINYEWDYSNDLKTQYLVIHESCVNLDLNTLAKIDIRDFNLNEVIKKEIVLSKGLQGIVEYVILKIAEEILKENYD